MQKKKNHKKHSDADRLRYMHLIEYGISIHAIHKKYGISDHLLLTIWRKYQKFGPSLSSIDTWRYIARREGTQTLDIVRKRGKPPGMSRPRKNSKTLTELDKLQKENLELKTEISLLKKLRALVE